MRMRLITGSLLFMAALLLFATVASARVNKPETVSFDPDEGAFNRYQSVITLMGAITRPGDLTELRGTFRILAVYRDEVTAALHGLNRHSITFYNYDVFSSPIRRRRQDQQFQQQGGGGNGRGNGGGGGGQGQSDETQLPPLEDTLSPQPPPIGGNVMQGTGGGGGGNNDTAGEEDPTFSVDDILVGNLGYVETKSGDILELTGLDKMREYSRKSISPGEIKIDIGQLFEWNHCLRLPDYPVWREDIWFATLPVSVPGLPNPLMCKFMYRVLGFTRIGMRNIAIIDTHGIIDFHEYWQEEDDTQLVKYEALGDYSVAARYFFDVDQGMIFGVERPPVWDFETNGFFIGEFARQGDFELKFPGLLANLNMRYYTEVTKKPKTKREKAAPVKAEPVDRRHVGLTFFMQTEAE
jgi:hypothetical protein